MDWTVHIPSTPLLMARVPSFDHSWSIHELVVVWIQIIRKERRDLGDGLPWKKDIRKVSIQNSL